MAKKECVYYHHLPLMLNFASEYDIYPVTILTALIPAQSVHSDSSFFYNYGVNYLQLDIPTLLADIKDNHVRTVLLPIEFLAGESRSHSGTICFQPDYPYLAMCGNWGYFHSCDEVTKHILSTDTYITPRYSYIVSDIDRASYEARTNSELQKTFVISDTGEIRNLYSVCNGSPGKLAVFLDARTWGNAAPCINYSDSSLLVRYLDSTQSLHTSSEGYEKRLPFAPDVLANRQVLAQHLTYTPGDDTKCTLSSLPDTPVARIDLLQYAISRVYLTLSPSLKLLSLTDSGVCQYRDYTRIMHRVVMSSGEQVLECRNIQALTEVDFKSSSNTAVFVNCRHIELHSHLGHPTVNILVPQSQRLTVQNRWITCLDTADEDISRINIGYCDESGSTIIQPICLYSTIKVWSIDHLMHNILTTYCSCNVEEFDEHELYLQVSDTTGTVQIRNCPALRNIYINFVDALPAPDTLTSCQFGLYAHASPQVAVYVRYGEMAYNNPAAYFPLKAVPRGKAYDTLRSKVRHMRFKRFE